VTSKREMMARLYADRVQRRVCVVCEQPAYPYVRCADCRGDQTERVAVRRLTSLLLVFMTSDNSTTAE
jgi:hypothetical protein